MRRPCATAALRCSSSVSGGGGGGGGARCLLAGGAFPSHRSYNHHHVWTLPAGLPEAALQDAEAALQLLCEDAQLDVQGAAAGGGGNVPSDSPLAAQLAKAFHRKAEAQIALGRALDGIKTYRQGVAICGPRQELHAALRLAAEQLPVPWLAKVGVARRVAGEGQARLGMQVTVLATVCWCLSHARNMVQARLCRPVCRAVLGGTCGGGTGAQPAAVGA